MVGQTRTSPNGFGATGSDAPPPPPNMTIQEQFMVTQTELMRQLLQTQQQLAQQLQNNPCGENIDGQPRVTKYEHFYAMKPPTFEEAKEPLAANAWIRAIEAKFSVFTLPCSEERKASFATLQLCGAVLIWWENFKTMITAGHQITWAEFKQAFKEHNIPKGLMDRKMKKLLALKQGSDTVYEYAKKFNALCQYGGHHVYNDAKKIERFRDGLHGDLYERLNLYEPNSYQDLVNKAISQEDAMSKAQMDRKRQAGFTATGESDKKFRFIKKGTQGPPQSSSTGHWRVTPSQNKPSGNFQFRKAQQQLYKPSAPPANNNNNSAIKDRRCYNCG
jgi:hypothetical protein